MALPPQPLYIRIGIHKVGGNSGSWLSLIHISYAANVGGIQRTVQIWLHGDQTQATLDVSNDPFARRGNHVQ